MNITEYQKTFLCNSPDLIREIIRERNSTRRTVEYLTKPYCLDSIGKGGEDYRRLEQTLLDEIREATKDWLEILDMSWMVLESPTLVGFRVKGIARAQS